MNDIAPWSNNVDQDVIQFVLHYLRAIVIQWQIIEKQVSMVSKSSPRTNAMGVTSEKRSRKFDVAENFEKGSFSGGLLLNLRCDLHHWSNDVLIA